MMTGQTAGKSPFQAILYNPWIPGALILILVTAIFLHLMQNRRAEVTVRAAEPPGKEEAGRELVEALARFRLEDRYRVIRRSPVEIWRISLPSDIAFPNVHLALQERFPFGDGWKLQARSIPSTGDIILDVNWIDSCYYQLTFIRDDRPIVQGRIAIIIDDFGEHRNAVVESFLKLPFKLTVSILPGRPMSRRLSVLFSEYGHEIFLHQPMEPVSGSHSRQDWIHTEMTPQAIERTLERSLADVPGAVGINNHMGSRLTSHRVSISLFLKEVRKRDLLFVDSRTTAESVAYDVARELGIPCAKRDVFLDVEPGREAVRAAFRTLLSRASQQRTAIGIGHCQQVTLDVLSEEIPAMLEQGFELVTLSEMLR